MPEEEIFTWFSLIPQLGPWLGHNPHVAAAGLVLVVLLIFSLIARRQLAREESVYSTSKFGVTIFLELALESILGLMDQIMGPGGRKFFPLIGSLALFIFFSNILGLIPGLIPPTQNWNTTAACAIVVFLVYQFFGFKEHGIKYLKHFAGPVWYLSPLMFPIEIISHLVRPLSLSMRLMGNMTGDHLVIGIFLGLFPFLLPLPVMMIGLLVAVIQTLIFILLSMVYISMAVEEEEH